jgi:hypothetical protein
MCRAVSRQAVYQRGRPRTRTHEALTTLAAVSLRDWVEYASHPSHLVCSLPVSHVSHPTIIIQSHRARAVRARGGEGEHDAKHGRDGAPHAGPQDIKKPIRVSNVSCVECAPPRGVELSFRGNLIYRLRVCAAVVRCRIYVGRYQRASYRCHGSPQNP